MAGPTLQDYQEALQDPAYCFADPELQSSSAQLNESGLPRPRSGNFATVFRVDCDGRSWAVRCFVTYRSDHEQRYREIHAALLKARPDWAVDFELQLKGIRVGGQWYPILKMAWVEGDSLSKYVEQHLFDQSRIWGLLQQWIKLVRSMREAGIAHGDLADANILVVDGHIKLVDYDGMFVPALSGMSGCEAGRRHYQPPWRETGDFAPDLDYFSAWVIFVSLYAITVMPSLWNELGGGDDCLLLRSEDFEAPYLSDAFRAIDNCGDATLSAVVAPLQAMLDDRSVEIQSVDQWFTAHPIAPPVTTSPEPWWRAVGDEETQPATSDAPTPSYAPSVTGASWVFDHLPGSPPVAGPPAGLGLWLDRMVLGACVALSVIVAWIFARDDPVYGAAPFSFLLYATAYVKLRYAPRQLVNDKRYWARKAKDSRQSVQRGEAALKRLGLQHTQLERSEAKELKAIRDDQDRRFQEARNELAAAGKKLQEAQALVKQSIGELEQERRHEKAEVLARIRQEYVAHALVLHSVASINAHGVGPTRKSRLLSAGILTAADVSHYRVRRIRGFGDVLTREVMAWRGRLESQAQLAAPQAVSAGEAVRIDRGIDARIATAKSQEPQWHQWYASEAKRIRAEQARIPAGTKERCRRISAKWEARKRPVSDELREKRQERPDALWAAARAAHELERFRNVGVVPYVRRLLGVRCA